MPGSPSWEHARCVMWTPLDDNVRERESIKKNVTEPVSKRSIVIAGHKSRRTAQIAINRLWFVVCESNGYGYGPSFPCYP
jgi:hypothetical protein